MAASLAALSVRRVITNSRLQLLTVGHGRHYATSCKNLETDNLIRIAEAPDKSCIICWHPEPEFPYEHTQPLPRRLEEAAEGESPLKVNLLMEEKLKMRPDGPTDQELSNMFFTTKHPWRPMQSKKRYRNPNRQVEREGL